MALTNQQAKEIAYDLVFDDIMCLDDDFGEVAEATAERYDNASDEDHDLVHEYVTDWRIRLQGFMRETGKI